MKRYSYIGDPSFIPKELPPRVLLDGIDAISTWIDDHLEEVDLENNIAATFIVDTEFNLWIAERSSEHVACARLEDVYSAGEIFLSGSGKSAFIDHITNQSTGYCPELDSWPAVAKALSDTGIDFPDGFDPEFVFRRCPGCNQLNIVREDFFVCTMCDADLPETYNVQGA